MEEQCTRAGRNGLSSERFGHGLSSERFGRGLKKRFK